MRILLLTHYFSPENGAPQRRWDAIIREFVAAGHEVRVFCPPPHHPSGTVSKRYRRHYRTGSADRDSSGAIVHRVGYLPHRGDIVTRSLDHLVSAFTSIARGSHLIRAKKFVPDVIIATAPAIPTLIAGTSLARRFHIPLVVEMRDAWPDLVTHISGLADRGGPVSFVKKIIHRWVTGLQGAANQIVTTTDAFAEILKDRGMSRVAVIRNGADAERFANIAPLDTQHTALRALYLGTIGRSQGLDIVVRAAHQLLVRGVDVQVRIIGEGHALPALIELNESLGSPVEILPAIDPAEVITQYEWADTTIATLRDWQPFDWTVPSKLYELLSTGRHVTAILAGEGAEILSQAKVGNVIAPGDVDAVIALWTQLADDRMCLDVGDSGREWAREHVSFAKLAAKYQAVLAGIAN